MHLSEIKELSEKAKESHEKVVGLTTAIFAVLLAVTTMLGHRSHTESVFLQTKANDQWAYYQAKNIRHHMYAADAKLSAILPNGKQLAESFEKSSDDQKGSADDILDNARKFEKEADGAAARALRFDTAEIFLEVAIVLCSITLLIEKRTYWRVSLISTLVGIGYIVSAFLMR